MNKTVSPPWAHHGMDLIFALLASGVAPITGNGTAGLNVGQRLRRDWYELASTGKISGWTAANETNRSSSNASSTRNEGIGTTDIAQMIISNNGTRSEQSPRKEVCAMWNSLDLKGYGGYTPALWWGS